MNIEQKLRNLADRWAQVPAAEKANYQLYLVELAEALDVARPQPRGSGYEFEYPVSVVGSEGSSTTKFADLYRRGHFVLEAKDEGAEESRDLLLRRAFGQARLYAAWVDGPPPPYLLVLDVGTTLVIWDRWSGTYGDYHSGYRINLRTLASRPDDIALLRDIWANPSARDPRGRSEAVTRDIAEHLAELATSLEDRGHESEVVARYLIRCVFTMFSEDVGLLPGQPFTRAVEEIGLEDPEAFPETLHELWTAMDEGGRFGLRKYLRFNGHFFHDRRVVSLTREDLVILLEAAQADWSDVEPSIMGELLTRALDPHERHKLGAEYTPREYVERLVRPTVEEPIRERWTQVQAEVLQLQDKGKKAASTQRKHKKQALESLRGFHDWLRSLRFLDPACGSGNFLYVTLNVVKGVELEVIRAIEEITGAPELAVEEVGPWQFHGIEVKAWAREIAELTLWIGYHQWWRRTHGHTQPPEPVLRDTGTLELRDAVLAWDQVIEDPDRSRPDPTPRIRSSVTGEMVPDPDATLPYREYKGARQAEWPEADYIIGNPPYMGRGRQREAFGDGYVDAIRSAYPDVPDNADYVMYWWYKAAQRVASSETTRAGLITTNSIREKHNREVIEDAREEGAHVIWAAADHPWVGETGSADVRVAMTVVAPPQDDAVLVEVDDSAALVAERSVPALHSDLTADANVAEASAQPLLANEGLSSQGFILVGTAGFVVDGEEARRLKEQNEESRGLIRPYMTGRDLSQHRRDQYVIDFGLRDEEAAKEHPVLYDIIRDRVKPMRDANARASYREYWWRYGEPRSSFRPALEGLDRYIGTVETAKHRVFTFLPAEVATSHKIICIALEDYYHLGVLSSAIHVAWANAAGGRLGVGNDPVYTKSSCFDPFPFPDGCPEDQIRVGEIAERLFNHRDAAIARSGQVTMTAMYNVIEKLEAGEPLTTKERKVHEAAACGTLRDIHHELDAAVAACYSWPWPLAPVEILARVVELHGERLDEERKGKVRWLRPEYQRPRFSPDEEDLEVPELGIPTDELDEQEIREWPAVTVEQIAAIQDVLGQRRMTVEDIASAFLGARRDIVRRHLETLVLMGEAVEDDGHYELIRPTPAVA